MTRRLLPPGSPPRARFAQLRSGAFRLETLPAYEGWADDPMFAAFRGGDPYRLVPAMHEWMGHLRANRASGITQSRVHVVTEPLSEYLRFELTWGYAPLAEAGEDVRIVDATDGWPAGVPRRDFWLVDDEVYWMIYTDDGRWTGSELSIDPDELEDARGARDAALAAAVPWWEFITRRPDLAVLTPAVG